MINPSEFYKWAKVFNLVGGTPVPGGDVFGPASSAQNAIARYFDTTGKIIKNSGVLIDDDNNIKTPGNVVSKMVKTTYTASSVITPEELMGRLLVFNLLADNANITLPDAASIYAAMGSPPVDTEISVFFVNENGFKFNLLSSDLNLDLSEMPSQTNFGLQTFYLTFRVTNTSPVQMKVAGGQDTSQAYIVGGTINNTNIGDSNPASGHFSTLIADAVNLPNNAQNIVYVSSTTPTGTPDGTYYNPFPNVGAVMAAALPASDTNPITIILSGVITETADVALKPFYGLTGLGPFSTQWNVGAHNITLDASWDAPFAFGIISNLLVNASNPIVFDTSAYIGGGTKLIFLSTVFFQTDVTVTADSSTILAELNSVNIQPGYTLTLNNVPIGYSFNSLFNGDLVVNSSSSGHNSSIFMQGNLFLPGSSASVNSTGTDTCSLNINSSTIQPGSLSGSGANTTIYMDVGSYTAATLSGGATQITVPVDIGAGGTGVTTLPAAGEFLVGNSGNSYDYATITGSSGVTVSYDQGAKEYKIAGSGSSTVYPPNYHTGLAISYVNPTTIFVDLGRATDSTNVYNIIAGYNNLDITTTGVNGIDTGTVAANSQYYLYLIGDSTGVTNGALIASLSPVAPTISSPYDIFRGLAAFQTDGNAELSPENIQNLIDPAPVTNELVYKYQPKIFIEDLLSQGAINSDIWSVVTDNIVTGSTPNNPASTCTESLTELTITGAPGVQYWSGIGLISTKSFDYTLDYDIQVDIKLNNNGATDSVAAIELYSSSAYNIGVYYSNSAGLQRFLNIGGVQTVSPIDSVSSVPYLTIPEYQTFLFKKRAGSIQIWVINAEGSEQLIGGFDASMTANFNIRLMGYIRASTDNPIIQFKNFLVNIYPVVAPSRTVINTPLLSGSGSGFDAVYVKDPEIVLGNSSTYYLYYSGFDGGIFASGYVTLGADLNNPSLGPRVQLNLNGATDNGAPSVYYDGLDFWLFAQTSAGPGASIQVLKSTTTGDPQDFTLQTTISGTANTWTDGIYDPCIVKNQVNGLYYLYFTATNSTFNTYGYTRTYGLATSTSLTGPWTIQGQVKLPSVLDNQVFGMEAPNVIYDFTYKAFHLLATGGALGQQEILLHYLSYDGMNFFPANDLFPFAPSDQPTFNYYGVGSASWINNASVDGQVFIYYQGQQAGGGNYQIGYLNINAPELFQRAALISDKHNNANVLPGGTAILNSNNVFTGQNSFTGYPTSFDETLSSYTITNGPTIASGSLGFTRDATAPLTNNSFTLNASDVVNGIIKLNGGLASQTVFMPTAANFEAALLASFPAGESIPLFTGYWMRVINLSGTATATLTANTDFLIDNSVSSVFGPGQRDNVLLVKTGNTPEWTVY